MDVFIHQIEDNCICSLDMVRRMRYILLECHPQNWLRSNHKHRIPHPSAQRSHELYVVYDHIQGRYNLTLCSLLHIFSCKVSVA